MKRLLLNLLALVVIVGVAYLAIRTYYRPPLAVEEMNPPHLETLTYRDGQFDQENGLIKIAAVADPDTLDASRTNEDILNIYRWARDILPDNGAIEIHLIIEGPKPVPVTEDISEATPYYEVLGLSLDKTQIIKMLREPPLNLNGLVGYHTQVGQTTGEAGGWVFSPDQPVLFQGFE